MTREAPATGAIHQQDLLLPQAFLGSRKAYIVLDRNISTVNAVNNVRFCIHTVSSRVPPLERHRLLRCARSATLLSYCPLFLCCCHSAILNHLLHCCPRAQLWYSSYRHSHSHRTQSLTICSQEHHTLYHPSHADATS